MAQGSSYKDRYPLDKLTTKEDAREPLSSPVERETHTESDTTEYATKTPSEGSSSDSDSE